MIAEEIINEIRSRADIVAVIGQHVQLRKAGRNWKGLCPFHGEKTPSFNVTPDKGRFICFGCNKKGDVFDFVMELEGKSFVAAAEPLGAGWGGAGPMGAEAPALRRARGEGIARLDINRHATAFFREVLADPARGEPGRAYLAKRGVGAEITDKFQLGYAPPDWHALADFLKAKSCDMELATRLGLVARQPRAGGYYDRYRDRLVCPVVVPGGEIVAFSARVIGKPPAAPDGPRVTDHRGAAAQPTAYDEPPKYINSPESTVYKKSRTLFGLAQAREGMQKAGRAVLVEGNFDVISLHQAGFVDVVAPLGTALTLEQVITLKRLTERIVLLYDGDKAGYKATMHALQMCVEADVEVLVASRPGAGNSGGAGPLAGGVDPDSLVASGGAAQLKEAIDRALGGIEYFCFEVWGKARANADARTRALEDAARLAAKIANPIKRDLVIDTFAKALDISINIVRSAVQRAAGDRGRDSNVHDRGHSAHPHAPAAASGGTPSAGEKSSAPPPTEELEVISLLADHPDLIASIEADKAFWLLTDGRLRDMYSAARDGHSLLETALVQLPLPSAKLVLSGKYTGHKDPRAQLAAMASDLELRKKMLDHRRLQKALVSETKTGTTDRELSRLKALLAQAQGKRDQALADQLLEQISTLSKPKASE